MALLERTQSFMFNSDAAAGATNVSPDGSMFQVSLNSPIKIPKDAVDCTVGVLQASVWNTSPNIAADYKNNAFEFTTSVAPAGTYSWVLPDGLYSLDGLNSYLAGQFVNTGLPSNLITISGDSATQKSIVTFLTSGDSINWAIVNSVRGVLGFASGVITAPSANYRFFSDSPAQFNRINSYLIASNLVASGIPVNNVSRGIISTIPINVSPGSQVNYSPTNVIWFDAPDLIGTQRSNLQFSLLDQNLRATPTAGDAYSVTVMIRYHSYLGTGVIPVKPA